MHLGVNKCLLQYNIFSYVLYFGLDVLSTESIVFMAIAILSIGYYSRTIQDNVYSIIITFSPCLKFIVLGAKFREHSAKKTTQHFLFGVQD